MKNSTLDLINNKIKPLIQSKEDSDNIYEWKIPKQDSPKERNGVLFYIKWKDGVLENMTWHHKGDYFATLSKNSSGKTQVYIHSLSKLIHQSPFSKVSGVIYSIAFHTNKPYFLVATNSNIFVYNLQKQEMVKKFVSNLNTITNLSLHKGGDNIIAGTKDGKVAFFQIDMSTEPFKILDYHGDKIKGVHFHNSYPLAISSSRNGKLLIYHFNIHEDIIADPVIVPLKSLKTNTANNRI
jgi:ribosome biogenesis protein ERB1